MSSNELFSDESGTPEAASGTPTPRRTAKVSKHSTGRKLGAKGVGRLTLGLILLIGTFVGLTVEAVITAAPAFAAQATTCIDPASGGTATTFHAGVTNSSYTVECQEETGISGTSAYPTITVATDTLPADGSPTLATGSACTTTTSGSGATEEYIEECAFKDSATAADESATPYTATFTSTPGAFTGSTLTPTTSGTLSVTINAPTVTCIDPASGGTAATFHEGLTSSYTVECEEQSGISSVTAYPTTAAVATDTLPVDSNPTFATSTSSSPACTTGTSGSGATEEYILECPFSATPSGADAGTYAATFSATGAGGVGATTSGPLNITVSPTALSCIDPASGGSASTFFEGSANSYTVECEAQSGISGVTAYPSSINIASGALPADGNPTFATSTSSSPACTTGTSGSGATEEYILECSLADTPTSADAGSYPLTFTATGFGGIGTVTSGTLTVTVNPPSTTCSTPAAGGTSASWVDGTAESETITCYSQGFGTANAGNYPSSITLNSGTLPSDVSEATSLSSSPACTTATSGSGTAEEYELECTVTETPVYADNGTYPVTFLATGGANGAPNAVSGTLTVTISQPAPSWATDGTTKGNYFSAIKGVPFCYDLEVSAGQQGPTGTNPGSTGSLPLISLTAGATPANVANYTIQDVNLTAGTAQICGTNNNTAASAPVTMAPVATNSGGSATDSIPLWSQNECAWSSTGSGLTTAVSMFDPNQDLETAGSQSAFGQPITNGVASGVSLNYATCTGGVGVSASGGLGDAWTMNTTNPLPTPTDSNPSAALGDLPSSNLDLASASGGAVGGCWGGTNILASTSTSAFGSGSTARMTLPSTWANGGDCAYGSLGSNSAGGNTDTEHLMNNGSSPATGDANCPPTQADVNAGLVNCAVTLSSGNDENGSTNYTSLDLFYNGQPVPQTPTASLSAGDAQPGASVSVTSGTNWWGANSGAPNAGPYGDFQNDSSNFYPVSAPQVLIGTSRGTAVPVADSTVTIGADSYACTGAESTSVGPNPCTLTVGDPTGTFQVPGGLAPGSYNVYIDESNTTPLPGNGPNDAYQTARGTNLGTAQSVTSFTVDPLVSVQAGTSSTGYGAAGNTIPYSYLVNNLDPTSALSGVTVADPGVSGISCPSSTLAIGASETCTGNYTVTQADVDNGSVADDATVSATDASSNPVSSLPSSITTDATYATSSLGLVKSVSPLTPAYGAAGDVLDYNYVVTNTGTTTESSISVADNLIATVTCPSGSLAPGSSVTCTGSYTVDQADVDTGSVINSATASGTNPQSVAVTSSPSSVTVEASNAVSGLSISKSTDSTGYGAVGDTINYTYLVTNTGTTTLDPGVTDNLIANVSCPDSSLAPGASETCTGSYTVTQADVTAGSVTNIAHASATDPRNGDPVDSGTSSVTVDATNDLSIVKSTNSTGYAAAGDTIDYSYQLTDSGNSALTDVAATDSLIGSVSCPSTTLAIGASETCTASYTVTQADVDAGHVYNNSYATALDSQSHALTSGSSSVTVLAAYATSTLSIAKSTTSTGYGAAGDTIPYSYLVKNTGTTTETNISVIDNKVATVSCPDSTLAPGASETCTGTYTVTQADVDAGSVTNNATANGTNPQSVAVTSIQSSVTVQAAYATSKLTLTKSTTSTGYGAAGNVLSFKYLVKNTGTTTLSNVGVSDNKIPSVSCPDSTLAPAASETCTGTYTVTQANVDAGSVTNTASADATNPQAVAVTSAPSSVTVEASLATSTLSIVEASTTANYHATGNVIHYTFKLTNTGTETLKTEHVTDNLATSLSCPSSTLSPAASETCTGSYAVTQANVASGSVTNTAVGHAVNPHSVAVTSASSAVTVHATGLRITTQSPLSAAVRNVSYSVQFAATGGTAPYSFYRVPGSNPLPPNLKFSTSGVLSGKPTTAGTYTISVGVNDSASNNATGVFTITVGA